MREEGSRASSSALNMEGRESRNKNQNINQRGASFHATSHKDLFENYVFRNFGKVYLGDDQACDITGKGDVKIQLNDSMYSTT
ncbi:hypothetical protein LWI28_022399 [Acer negundo]|uniref:Retrovirus-related Pol polyprotein from transposon TNT 1-94-like beta-barrel domain-containing protein n=1 Tax=Acer negundo TaxID=4023 RepID=A0AAD5NG19_ACENE|nr:hypothetical protein LWI28_022399 [Acer negundo]